MSSELDIWNMAMSHLGQKDGIQSKTENSAGADACRMHYETARKVALKGYDWGFARKYAAVSLVAGTIETGSWQYAYSLPVDCLAVRRIDDSNQGLSDPIPYEISIHDGGKVMLTNQADVVIRYTADVKDTNMFDPEFEVALSLFLGAQSCMMVTRKADLKRELDTLAQKALDAAAAQNLNEPKYKQSREADSVLSRL